MKLFPLLNLTMELSVSVAFHLMRGVIPMVEDFDPYDIRTLKKQQEEGIKHDFLFFWGHTPRGKEVDQSCLSQWYPCSFAVDGITYNCADQYMMAEKARLFGDSYTCDKIMRSSDPEKMKALGRKVRH